ncbi:hypothetical protein EPO15_08165 [bacterium]|nr:MAG: hypothetical protein EPO15_08165 [bacterium]
MTRLRAVCLALLLLDLLYCVMAVTTVNAPSWDMFAKVEPLDFELTDARGAPVDLRASLPRAFYLVRREMLPALAECACRLRPEPAPWRLRLKDGSFTKDICVP